MGRQDPLPMPRTLAVQTNMLLSPHSPELFRAATNSEELLAASSQPRAVLSTAQSQASHGLRKPA